MTYKLTELPAWQALKAHHADIATLSMQDSFAQDTERFSRFSLQLGDLLLDYSKNRITPETLSLLQELAKSTRLAEKIDALFLGAAINTTENRPALHTALRCFSQDTLELNGTNLIPLVQTNLDRMRFFTEQIRSGAWKGSTGKPIRDIVNIGIGGSHLGPLLTTSALADFGHPHLRCHFIFNIDATHIHDILNPLDPETTLFIISSKSFTTLETVQNANAVKSWLRFKLPGGDIRPHFVGVTAALEKAQDFGIPAEQIFPLWDWVGGRYSIWSAIGLPLAIFIGMDHFCDFLRGAEAMDTHFKETDFSENMPVLLGLLGIWYINFFAHTTHAIVPYAHRLTHLKTYLQQADMESNGKHTTHDGRAIDYATGPIIWGEQGCHGQHAFHQLLHQSQHGVPVDFILVGKNANDIHHHQDILIASALSQAQALLYGKSYEDALAELLAAGHPKETAECLAHHKAIPGNRPSNTLLLNELTPYNLGALLALYEHKIFVQGAIWDINSFDQWGVELGKLLLPNILADLQKTEPATQQDSSTLGLIEHYKKVRGVT